MRAYLLFPLLSLAACGDDGDTEESGGESDTTTEETGDTSETTDTSDTTPPAPSNEKANGTWALGAPGSTCNGTFAGDWVGAASTANEQAFTLTLTAEQRTLTCSFDLADPTRFTCNDVSQGGQISNCDVAMFITQVNGTVIGADAQLNAHFQMTSSACGSALNCGPSPHTASGTISPPTDNR